MFKTSLLNIMKSNKEIISLQISQMDPQNYNTYGKNLQTKFTKWACGIYNFLLWNSRSTNLQHDNHDKEHCSIHFW